MKRFVLASVGALSMIALMGAANAADLPRRETMPVKAPAYLPYNWTGAYIGINGGGGFGGRSSFDGLGVSDRPSGALFGGQLGYNWQFGRTVVGLETDIDYSDIRGSTACGAFTCETRNKWLGTTRARIGYAFDRFLPYLTGGVAYGKVRASNSGFGTDSDTRVGYALGGGVEFALAGPWTAKVEYLYTDLGNFDCATCGVLPSQNVDFRTNVVRAGINYRF
jgi:outer membrane immunogenic protein